MGQRLPAADRRVTIVDAALEVFGRRSYDDVSLDEVAARAGVTKPILYRHFASKEELYVKLLDEQAEAMEQKGWSAAGNGAPTAVQVVAVDRRLAVRAPRADAVRAADAGVRAGAVTDDRVRPAARERVTSAARRCRFCSRCGPTCARATLSSGRLLEPYCAMIAGAQARAARWWLDTGGGDRDAIVKSVVGFLVAAVAAIEAPAP